jgi:hypothetical protein
MSLIFLLLELGFGIGWALTQTPWVLGVTLGLVVCNLFVLGVAQEELEHDVRKLDPRVRQVEDANVGSSFDDYTKG